MARSAFLRGVIAVLGVLAAPAVQAHPFDPFAEDKQEILKVVLDHMREGQTQEALLQADQALLLFPKHGPFYALKAQILLTARRIPEALTTVNRAIELSPDYALAYWLRGLIRMHEHDPAAALLDFEHVLKIEDQDPNLIVQAQANRGMAKADLGRYAEAIDDLNAAIEARPTAFAERQFRAGALLALNRLEAAQADIEMLEAADPQNSLTLRLRGELWLKRQRPERARAALDQAIGRNSRDAIAYRLRAQAHRQLKQPGAYRTDMAKACSLGDKPSCTLTPGAKHGS